MNIGVINKERFNSHKFEKRRGAWNATSADMQGSGIIDSVLGAAKDFAKNQIKEYGIRKLKDGVEVVSNAIKNKLSGMGLKKKRKASAWNMHVAEVRKSMPGAHLKEVLQKAKSCYKSK